MVEWKAAWQTWEPRVGPVGQLTFPECGRERWPEPPGERSVTRADKMLANNLFDLFRSREARAATGVALHFVEGPLAHSSAHRARSARRPQQR